MVSLLYSPSVWAHTYLQFSLYPLVLFQPRSIVRGCRARAIIDNDNRSTSGSASDYYVIVLLRTHQMFDFSNLNQTRSPSSRHQSACLVLHRTIRTTHIQLRMDLA